MFMKIHITGLLKELCLKNGVDLDFISSETIRVLSDLGIEAKNIEVDLGTPANSYSYPYNSESFSVLLDPLSIANVKEGKQFEDALCYELGHEISHSVISQELRFMENATLEVGWFLKNGFPLDETLKALIKNCLENIKIDSELIKNSRMMRGFYTRQYIEYAQTKKYLDSEPPKDKDFVWLGEFLSVCRRALVSRRAQKYESCQGIYRTLDMNFRSQIGKILSVFKDRDLDYSWLLFKTQEETGEDFTYDINDHLISMCDKSAS